MSKVTTHKVIRKIKDLIHGAEETAQAKEAKERAAGKKLTNGPLARLCCPPRLFNPEDTDFFQPARCIYPDIISIIDDDGRKSHMLYPGETGYLTSRRQWGAYEEAHRILREAGLPDDTRWALIHELFEFTYGTMAICRRFDEKDTPRVLLGIRGAKLGGVNVGRASFPAGLVKPRESLEIAYLRELEEETGLDHVMIYPGWATFRLPNACSMTFSALSETRSKQALKPTYEVKGGVFIWVCEDALYEAVFTGEAKRLTQDFIDQDIHIDGEVEISNDGAATYKVLAKAYPAVL